MPLLNYRTGVSVAQTIGEIHDILARHGARAIMTDYDGKGSPVALSFVVLTAHGERSFRLPANVEGVRRALKRQRDSGELTRAIGPEPQVQRIAWRTLKDWIEAQTALIEAEMASIDEVMLPYLIVGHQGQTLYQVVAGARLALPPGRE